MSLLSRNDDLRSVCKYYVTAVGEGLSFLLWAQSQDESGLGLYSHPVKFLGCEA